MLPAQLRCQIGENSKSKSVDDDRAARRDGQKARACRLPLLTAWMRKAVAEIDKVDGPAKPLEFADDAAIVGKTAGRGRKIARYRKRHALHHKGDSYQARATCDSDSVTRIAFSSRPSRPSFPARAESARQP